MKGTAKGKVCLVGAGPGDAGLITVRGRQLLRRAEVVIHDRLIGLELGADGYIRIGKPYQYATGPVALKIINH